MSAWTNTYTRKGLALLSKLTQGSSLKITRAVTGTGYVTPSTLANQVAVSGIKQNLSFKAASYPETGVCKLPMFVTNEGITAGYRARQVGIYALDPNEGEILYFIAQSDTGADVPSEIEMPEYSATWTFYFRYGQADNVNVTVDPSHTITEDMLNEVRVIAETGVSAPNKGATLAIENTAELPFAGLRLFGKTTQNGTPSPDNPVDLVPVGDPFAAGSDVAYLFTIEIFGKNLFIPTVTSKTDQSVTATKTDDGNYVVDGTASGNIWIELGKAYLIAGQTYTVSANKLLNVQIWDSTSGNSLTGKHRDSEYKTFVAKSTGSHGICLAAYSNKADVYSNVTANILIELGAKVSPWCPSVTSHSFELVTPYGLNGIPVKSGGNYTDADGQQWICDEIDFARGVYVQRVKQVTYDGDEAWIKSEENNYYTRVMDAKRVQPMCDKLGPRTTDTAPHIRDAITGDGVTAISVSLGAGVVSSADEFKSALSQNPLQVLYALATPIETPLTADEIAAFDALHSNNPVTTINNYAGANMEVDCFLAQHEAGFKRIINYVQRYLLAQ